MSARTETDLLTADELANCLRLRPATVRLWTRQGIIPAIRITAKVIRYDLAEVTVALRRRSAAKEAR